MKILCLIDNLGSGGAQRQLVTLACLWKQTGHDVELVTYQSSNFWTNVLINNGIKIHFINAQNYLLRIIRVRNYLRDSDANVVVSFLNVPNFLACISKFGSRRQWRLIISERSLRKTYYTTLKDRIFVWCMRYADYIVCNSALSVNNLGILKPLYKPKIRLIYNLVTLPLSLDQIDYVPLKDGKLHLVIAASFQYLKNPIGFVKALSLLDSYYRDRLIVDWYGAKSVAIGGTAAYDEAFDIVKKNDLSQCVRFHDATNDVISIMKRADCIGIFSQYEGLPNAICEGMMLGKPIIMSRVSDYNILIDKTNGFLCDWNDSISIKQALERMIDTPVDLMLKMGEQSRKRANILFSRQTIDYQWNVILNVE